ncbi:hypothetical protein EDB86DRAFT_2795167 [Lactarius hatsudake]|nr:hypothetical protein EDB86DRAFT_2795167 [Lactarius hatsudake]
MSNQYAHSTFYQQHRPSSVDGSRSPYSDYPQQLRPSQHQPSQLRQTTYQLPPAAQPLATPVSPIPLHYLAHSHNVDHISSQVAPGHSPISAPSPQYPQQSPDIPHVGYTSPPTSPVFNGLSRRPLPTPGAPPSQFTSPPFRPPLPTPGPTPVPVPPQSHSHSSQAPTLLPGAAITVPTQPLPSLPSASPTSPTSTSTRPPSPVKSAPSGPSRPYTTAGSSAPRPVSPTKSTLPSPCGGCGGPIVGRIVSAMGVRWHPGCFRCSDCDDLLEYVSSYERDGKPYCHFDYHERFAPRCYHCKTAIVDERFITLDDPELGKRTYHEQHFFCSECGDPFLAPSIDRQNAHGARGITFKGDGEFENDDVGFTVYKGYPYCETCHVRLRSPKCKKCKNGIRDGMQAVEALGGKYHWECFCCTGCDKPFDDPSFFLRENKPFCERCYSIILKSEF